MSITWCTRCKSNMDLNGTCQCLTSYTKLKTISYLPEEFVRHVESDLNKIPEYLPEHLHENIDEFEKYWKYDNITEFLVGYCVGTCTGIYIQSFIHFYKIIPGKDHVLEINKMVARRRSQIEQGVNAFLDETSIK